ncbi:MAG: SCP2 sterol-binding domain-containing protein [Candidatus Helarchaeota archaeon]
MSIDEYKKLVKELEEDFSKDKIMKIIEMTPQVGFVNIIKDEELKEFMTSIRDKLAEISVDDLKEIIPKFTGILFSGMKELLDASEEAQEELEDMEDMSLVISVPDMNLGIYIKIEDGKLDAGEGELEEADLKIKMGQDTFMKMVSGDIDAMQAYMSGEIQLEGDMTKAMAIRPLFDILADEYDFEIGLMG